MSKHRVILSLVLALTACAPEHAFTSDAQPTDTVHAEAAAEDAPMLVPDSESEDAASADATAAPDAEDSSADASEPDAERDAERDAVPDRDAQAQPDVAESDALDVVVTDAVTQDVATDRTVVDTGVDTGVPPRDTGVGCTTHAECADGIEATMDLCLSGRCENRSCDDGNPCTRDVGSAMGCANTVLPDGTMCRPAGGSNTYVCTAGVCPSCGGEGQACCDWPGSSQVCQAAARCRVVSGGFRRCVTCGGAGQRCCELADGISMASQRCSTGLSCSSLPGVPGTCR